MSKPGSIKDLVQRIVASGMPATATTIENLKALRAHQADAAWMRAQERAAAGLCPACGVAMKDYPCPNCGLPAKDAAVILRGPTADPDEALRLKEENARLVGIIKPLVLALAELQALVDDDGELLCPLACCRGKSAHVPDCPWPALVAEAEKL